MITLVTWTWGTWPDVMVDFGREFYIPWRLAEGEVLYRDIAYFNGPLSPYVNSLWFRLFGVHLDTLVWANLVILTAISAVMYRLLRQMGGALGATAGTLVFLTVSGIAQLDAGGNYNFVTPYAHELTHGTFLALTALLCVRWFQRRGGDRAIIVAGLLVGLAFLTKAEIFLATSIAVTTGVLLTSWTQDRSTVRLARSGIVLLLSASAPPVVAWWALALRIGSSQALVGVLGSWPGTFTSSLSRSVFYSRMLGIDRPVSNFVTMCAVSLLWCAVYGAAAFWSYNARSNRPREAVRAVLVGTPILVLTIGNLQSVAAASVWLLRPLPIAISILALLQLGVIQRHLFSERESGGRVDRAILRLSWIVFAGLILSKVALRPIPSLYGFALAMPATVVIVAAAVEWLPAELTKRRRAGRQLCAISLVLVGSFCIVQVSRTHRFIGLKTETVATDRGSIRVYPVERTVADVLKGLQENLDVHDTLAIMPEGVMLNFLTGHINPTPFINFMPPELALFGESNIVRAFESDPPDWMVLTYKPVPEYGLQGFGIDFGLDLARWVTDRYAVDELYEVASPFERRFTKLLLVHRSPHLAPTGATIGRGESP